MVFVKYKKTLDGAKTPEYAKEGDACVDLVAVKKWRDDNGNICYDTGISFELPENHLALLFPRSSISKTQMRLSNSVGVIDAGYRGNIIAKFKPGDGPEYEVGDRVCQVLILPRPPCTFLESDTLSTSDRGSGGFGSTGV